MTAADGNGMDSPSSGALEYKSVRKSGCMIAFLICMSAASLILGATFFTIGLVFPGVSGSLSLGFCVKLFLASLLIVSAFGLLTMRRWGRRLAIAAAAGQLVMCIVHILYSIHQIAAVRDSFFEILGKTGFYAVSALSIFIVALGLVYPAILLILLGKSEAKTFFK